MARDTGFPRADAENDFMHARRREVLSRLANRLRFEPDDVGLVLPYDEVVAALGWQSEHFVGLDVIELDSVVGSMDRTREFDRRFRPTSNRSRERWQRIALAQRQGESMPPIDVYRIGDLHFVRDGHHRVSVAHALSQTTLEAYVTAVNTRLSISGVRSRRDLVVKSYERVLADRVPLPGAQRASLVASDPWTYAELGEAVEAWGCRAMQDEGRFLDRREISRRWYDEEFRPVVHMLRDADLIGRRTDSEAYLRVATERYRLIRTHEWSDDIIARLRDLLA
ncbi:MAG: chromosome partitioning protein ParB [Mycobacteriales bacterium]